METTQYSVQTRNVRRDFRGDFNGSKRRGRDERVPFRFVTCVCVCAYVFFLFVARFSWRTALFVVRTLSLVRARSSVISGVASCCPTG